MIVVLRFAVPAAEEASFLAEARTALEVLSQRAGWRSSRVGRATDDPQRYVLVTEWDSVGVYRRALSAYDVKVQAVPLLSRALDEPSAYEVLAAAGLGSAGLAGPSGRALDADVTGPGAARIP